MSVILIILVASLATIIPRALPYFLFKGKGESYYLKLLQKNSALFIMIILIFYALNSNDFSKFPYGLNEILAIFLALVVQILSKNALLSIASSTALYMVLIRFVM